MTAFRRRVAQLTGTPEGRIERLAGGDLSEVLLLRRPDGRRTVAKANSLASVEASMLRALGLAGLPVPAIEGEFDTILLLGHIENDQVFSAASWRSLAGALKRLHVPSPQDYGWPVDYRLGSIDLDNRERRDWPAFWCEQRITAIAAILDRPWRARVATAVANILPLLPAAPPAALLHGDLWSGNILVAGGQIAALIDPACCYGDAEADLAMLCLFDAPPEAFWSIYGPLAPGWEERRSAYQLFPALVHLRLFGTGYAPLLDQLLKRLGA